MASADTGTPAPAQPAALPDYLTDPDAVLRDKEVKWRYGRAPDYTKTRKVFAETKKMNHEAGSLPQLVENLVKNWEVEASFKPHLEDWRSIDAPNYSFAINGGPPQTAEHMLKVGTYNAIIAPNEYYSPVNSDFASSHKTFKRMMPSFAWEVLEVYSGPPHVSFRWRHWGTMKNDYVGFNDKDEKVTAKAHGGPIDIQGVTVATVDDKIRLQRVETWFDPMDMFRQIAPQGVVNKEPVARKSTSTSASESASTATPNLGPEQSEPADTLHPVPYQALDAKPVKLSQLDGTALEPVGQQSISDAQAEALPPASHKPNDVQDADGNWLPSHSGRQTDEQGLDTNVEPDDDKGHKTAETGTHKSKPLPGHVHEPEEHDQEAEMWHEAEATMSSFDVLPPVGCEPEKFHDALEGERALSIGSSEAESWTNVTPPASEPVTPRKSIYSSGVTGAVEHERTDGAAASPQSFSGCPVNHVHPHPKDIEKAVEPQPGEAIATSPDSEETRLTHLEMSKITPTECPFLLNRE
ncbi:uncharacterized protein K452DRAFT_354163 [Aplosporella prunicola CBS 121167]|uniref:SnoaL-like domain-containing protein n=1 Tax=Aplosporella prunicola CBS 121167 TaxID=1176127 RepID=A0A6A6AXH8_9PEZI|nr:uncharacterized protein K452DRAFT_354163 [Aplosporella prunicola CBS 121167]KAF2135958.1 hypothetical protein K452DRAFT_354163 [Aplosporella prunicola CBS 121167]